MAKLTGADRLDLLKAATKRKIDHTTLKPIYDEALANATTPLTNNLVAAIDAIGNARFPKAWAEAKAA